MSNSLIEQFKRDVESFEENFLNKWFPPEVDAFTLDGDSRGMRERGRDAFITATLNLINKMIEGCEGGMIPEDDSYHPKDFYHGKVFGNNSALSNTISQLVEFREYLEELKK